MAQIRPLGERVVIARASAEDATSSGIIIPDVAKEKPVKGTVLAVGAGRVSSDGRLTPLDVKVGDLVLFNKYAGNEVEVDGEKVLIMSETEILGVLLSAETEHAAPDDIPD